MVIQYYFYKNENNVTKISKATFSVVDEVTFDYEKHASKIIPHVFKVK